VGKGSIRSDARLQCFLCSSLLQILLGSSISVSDKSLFFGRFTKDNWEVHALDLDTGTVVCSACCFSPNGDYVILGTNKGSMIIYNSSSLEQVHSLKVTPSSLVKQISFSRSGRDMIVNSSDRIIRTYAIAFTDDEDLDILPSGKFMDAIERTHWLSAIISSDGEYVIGARESSEKHSLYLWDLKSGVLVKQLDGPLEGMSSLSWHPTKPVCASISLQYGCIYLWRHTPLQKFSAYEPTFTELEDNLEYEEREDEFDLGVVIDSKSDHYQMDHINDFIDIVHER